MINKVGDKEVTEVDINECLFCSAKYTYNPYRHEQNIYDYPCGLSYHVLYLTPPNGGEWPTEIEILTKCEEYY